MKTEVSAALEELKLQFSPSALQAREDGQGGAYVVIEEINLPEAYSPQNSWIGFQIPAQYPYADIYPVFIDGAVQRKDGRPHQPPVTNGHNFEGRQAIQVSRRNSAAQNGQQKASTKILKVLDYLRTC